MSKIEVEKLNLHIGENHILKDIALTIEQGKTTALVGESGSGKSITALSIMRLLPNAASLSGSIKIDAQEIVDLEEDEMCKLRGDDIGMVFQEPMSALNPVKTIGEQVSEGLRWHQGLNKQEALAEACKILARVGLPQEDYPHSRYPHELSGGQRQRVVIAIACAMKPMFLIADEPTTALDVVIQAQILKLLKELVAENNMGLLLISHDLAVVGEMADSVTILKNGKVVEAGSVASVMQRPKQAYTKQLIKASTHVPKRKKTKPNEALEPLVSLKNVTRDYKGKREWFFSKPELNRAVDDVSFEIMQGQSCALVGQSGCGKSTLARMILALDMPTSGEITFLGQSIGKLNHKELRPIRRNLSAIFQDPFGSFNPRHKVEKLVCEPLSLLNTLPAPIEQRKLAIEALEDVGLQESDLHKYPHEFSGGQRQRIAIARAIITKPKLIICDEPVSALDVSIQAQTLDLFTQLKERYGIAYLFITHDLHVAKAITDTILIMHEGRIVETGDTQEVFNNPKSEAGKTLLASMPSLDKVLKARAK